MSKKRSFKAVALGSIAVFTFLAIIGRKEEAKPVEPTEAERLKAELKVLKLKKAILAETQDRAISELEFTEMAYKLARAKRLLAEEQEKTRQHEADAEAGAISVLACGKLDTPEKRTQFWERERQRFIDAGEVTSIAESHATNALAKRLLAENR